MSEVLRRIDPLAFEFVPLGCMYSPEGSKDGCFYFESMNARGSLSIAPLLELTRPLPETVRG